MENRSATKNKRNETNIKRARNRSGNELDQHVVDISRVVRVVAGGRRFRFRAAVVVGDRKGRVGLGVDKSADVAGAVEKAASQGRKHLINAQLSGGTIPHEIIYKYEAAKVLLRPAPEGKSLIAGGALRGVLELAGVRNIVCKILGSNNKIANIRATLLALQILETKEQVMARRGIKLEVKSNEVDKALINK